MSNLRKFWKTALLSVAAAALGLPALATVQTPVVGLPVSLTGTVYTQNFDLLTSGGTTANVLPIGWGFLETGASYENNLYSIGNGSSATGDTYSFGAPGSTERAFGTLRNVNGGFSQVGALIQNSTGTLLQSLKITFTGEQWRRSGTGAADQLDFQLNQNPYGGAAFVDYNALDFKAPNIVGAPGALDGNALGNQAAITFTITGLSIPTNQVFAILWSDFDAIGTTESGLAIDSVSIQAVPEPSTVFGVSALLLVIGWRERRRFFPRN